MTTCPFCEPDRPALAENAHAFALYDKFPASPGHALVIPRTHVESLFDLATEAYEACFLLIRELRAIVQEQFRPAAFNIGVNCGVTAGQTVAHAHIHLIPRYVGDSPNPRGGVRAVIPGKAAY